jgi:hypothetical protein
MDERSLKLNAATTIANENIAILIQAEKLITDLSETLYATQRVRSGRLDIEPLAKNRLSGVTMRALPMNPP